jgi:uncharacterized protein YybS (DUF2232 family)
LFKKNFDAVETVLASSLVVFFVLFGFYVPTLGFLGLLLMAVPICVITYKKGIFYGLLSLFLSGIVLAILLPYLISVIICAINFSLGIVMGQILKKEKPINVLLATTAALAGLFALGIAYFILTGPKDLMNNLYAAFESYMISYYQGSSQITTDEIKQFVKSLEIYLPSLIILLFFVWSAFQYKIVLYILRYVYKIEIAQFGDFKEIRIPYELSLLFLISLIASFFPISSEIKNVFLNIELILTLVYMFAGISVLLYILSKKLFFKNNTLTRIINFIIVMLFVFVPFLSFLLIFLGIFDSVFNMRKYFHSKF